MPEGRYPSFTVFCQFVSDEARIACGPCNTRTHQESKSQDHSGKPRKAGTFATQAAGTTRSPGSESQSSTPMKCHFCKASHHISRCESFLGQDMDTKKSFAKDNSLCFGCLRRNHIIRDCRNRNPELMGYKKREGSDTEKPQPKKDEKDGKKDGQETAIAYKVMTSKQDPSQDSNGPLHSMILPVMVSHKDKPELERMTYALLDNMSDSCFITGELIKQLEAESVATQLEVTTLVSKRVITTEMVKDLTIRVVTESITLSLPKTFGRDEIPMDRSLIPRPETVRKWPHLQDVAEQLLGYQEDLEIGLLIGANCSAAMLPKKIVAGGDQDPYAMKTALGWGVIGWVQMPDDLAQEQGACFVHRTSAREISPLQVQKMFEVEFAENATGKMSVDDRQFMKKVEKGIHQRPDGHFEMPLPLKEDVKLPDNKAMAMKRLEQLKTRLIRNEKFRMDYTDFMNNVIRQGCAEAVPTDELKGRPGRVWYIPHHGVYHPKKPDKIRVVYDCSAEYQGEVLNRHLLQGPDLTNNLTGILCRFREETIAVTCDIEGMFHQVGVDKQDRDLLRFLWWEKGDVQEEPKEYRMTVHLFGATSSPACANFVLKSTADTYEEKFGMDVANFVKRNFYVDDGLQSMKTPEEAVRIIEGARGMCKAGGFNLHKFVCNDKAVVACIPEDIRAKNIQEIDLKHDALPVERTLGVEWCVESDTFQFRISLTNKPSTRRGILSSISSIYDPLGLVAPFLLTGKKILQEVCRDGNNWDDPISEDLQIRWNKWRCDLAGLSKLQVQRCYKPDDFGTVVDAQLHHFSDASLEGYGECSYLRLIDENGHVTTSLVMAKSRVTPTKAVTVPRLELTAALAAVKVSEFLNKELTYKEVQNFFWTDSKVVLGYITNESKRFHIYVANRVQQIRDRSEVQAWHHVKTSCNPADLASRGMNAQEVVDNELWWKGPAFLTSGDALPLMTEVEPVPYNDPEVKKGVVHSSVVKDPGYADLSTRLEYFSSRHRARKAVAQGRRYLHILKLRAEKKDSSIKGAYQTVNVTEIKEAERVILKATQLKLLPESYTRLGKNYPTTRDQVRQRCEGMNSDTNLYRLDPYLSTDGLLRVGGRIHRASIPRELAHPIIVPSGHIAKLLIQFFHQKTGHSGRTTTINEIRAAGYWILRGWSLVRSIIDKCVLCRKLRYPAVTQRMADLPADRLTPAPPFTYTGVDYFGPFYVKEGRSEKKRWGCLFTCLVTRAVHIEVANSLTTDSFLNAYRRLVGRRGAIRTLRCDQGTSFVGAKAELAAALAELDQQKIKGQLLKDECDWVEFNMNPPHASHMGGVWERMIRSARAALNALLEQHASSLDDELLHTLMVEAEAIINSRPLTELEPDMEPLTPAQLLTLKTKAVMPPPGNFVKEDLYCRKRWRRVQFLANEFWSRWRKEYLPTIQRRQKWNKPQPNLQEGDVVLMIDETVPRCQWPRAIVIQVYPSDDGLVRKVRIKTSTSEYDRPVVKMILLYRPGIPAEEPSKQSGGKIL